jgi:hypothetical protein
VLLFLYIFLRTLRLYQLPPLVEHLVRLVQDLDDKSGKVAEERRFDAVLQLLRLAVGKCCASVACETAEHFNLVLSIDYCGSGGGGGGGDGGVVVNPVLVPLSSHLVGDHVEKLLRPGTDGSAALRAVNL